MKTYPPQDPEIIDLGVWADLGAPETIPKSGALRAPPCEVVSGAPGAVQTPQVIDFWLPEQIGFHDYIDTTLGLTVWLDHR